MNEQHAQRQYCLFSPLLKFAVFGTILDLHSASLVEDEGLRELYEISPGLARV